jgi:ABC-type transport system substrate-binding protein
VSRRRALATSAGAAIGTALLAACGGGDEEQTDTSGLLAKLTDTSKSAKRGGVIKNSLASDVASLDPHLQNAPSTRVLRGTVSRLVNIKPGYLAPANGELIGDLAESWEFSPDGLQLTMTLRPGVFWHPIAPVNGRAFDIQDATYSWNRFASLGQLRSELVNAANPDAPVLSVQTPDSRRMVFNLKFPLAGLLALLAPANPGGLLFLPREAESGYQVQGTVIGTGPWYISDYRPSASMTFKRHPQYWDKERPYADEVSLPIISEYATGISQFRAGSLYSWGVRAEDIVQTKRDVPELNLYRGELSAISGLAFFGWKQGSVFRDERVRQAFSMSWDRDAFIDVMSNVSQFESEGIDMETAWSTCYPCDYYTGWWLDPQSKEFGANAMYLQHNVAEAKKLLAAAGHTNGVQSTSNWPPTGYGTDLGKKVEILEGMALEAGFQMTTNNLPFNGAWVPQVRDARGNFDGVAYRSGQTKADAIESILPELSISGNLFTIVNDGKEDPVLEDLIARGRREFDAEKRKALVHEIQRYNAKKVYSLRAPGGASTFSLHWPVLKNAEVYKGDQRLAEFFYTWLDESQPPVSKKA